MHLGGESPLCIYAGLRVEARPAAPYLLPFNRRLWGWAGIHDYTRDKQPTDQSWSLLQ
jgi:hypothetical protein